MMVIKWNIGMKWESQLDKLIIHSRIYRMCVSIRKITSLFYLKHTNSQQKRWRIKNKITIDGFAENNFKNIYLMCQFLSVI